LEDGAGSASIEAANPSLFSRRRSSPSISFRNSGEGLSPANSWKEMLEKMPLYFEVGAQEVWIVDTGGAVFFFGAGSEKLEKSRLIPDAPEKI